MSTPTIPVHFRVSKDGSVHSVKQGLETLNKALAQCEDVCKEAMVALDAMTIASESVASDCTLLEEQHENH